jgi:hypothetical protein
MAHFSRAAMNIAPRILGEDCLLAMFFVLSKVTTVNLVT